MKKFDLKPTEDIIEKIWYNHKINRHQQIKTLLKILSLIDDNTVIAIDAPWGAGKTFFVKELMFVLNNNEILKQFNTNINFNGQDEKCYNENKLKNTVSLYYNAWENDKHQEPLDSILFNLLNEFPNHKDKLVSFDKVKEIGINIIKDLAKNTLKLDIDNFLSSFNDYDDYAALAKDIFTMEEKKNAINEIISAAAGENRIIIIIDELDRCRPDFAVNLLETIKHFYDNPNITFILSVNNEQLAHTVKKFYGNNFDGFSYLHKFYDLIITLPKLEIKDYLMFALENSTGKNLNEVEQKYKETFRDRTHYHFYNNMHLKLIDYYDLSLRDINKILIMDELLKDQLDYVDTDNHINDKLILYFIVPLLLTLKVIDIEQYNLFINGKGQQIIRDICNVFKNDEKFLKEMESICKEISEEKIFKSEELIISAYKAFLGNFLYDKVISIAYVD